MDSSGCHKTDGGVRNRRGVYDTHGFYNWFFVTQSKFPVEYQCSYIGSFPCSSSSSVGWLGLPWMRCCWYHSDLNPKVTFQTSLPLQISSFRQPILKWVQVCSQLRVGPKIFAIYPSKNLMSAHPSTSSPYRDSLVSAHCMLSCFLLMPFEIALWPHLF